MKPKFFFKAAVVAMAAFGAFAFNGNTQENDQFSYKDGEICTNVSVSCSNDGNYTCQVMLQSDSRIENVFDLDCLQLMRHNSPEILDEL